MKNILTSKFLILSVVLFLFLAHKKSVFAQGCSDAGFCTMGAMRPDQPFSKKLNIRLRSVSLTQYVGLTKFDDKILSYIAEANVGISDKWQAQIKLPYTFVQGPLANTQGIGDISLSLTRTLIQKKEWQLNATLGAKIPTNNANFKNDIGLSLPMYYQSSLGTYDLIAGIAFLNKNFLFAAGIQHPFNQIDNGFKWGIWKEHPLTETANHYPVAQFLDRGTDAMLRAEYNLRFSKWSMNIGILPIYRFTPDVITSPQTSERIEVQDSKGVAVSGLIGGTYNFSARSSLKLLLGKQLQRRYSNPDGLSREWVNTITYNYLF
ncbi:hypothetical protein Fleli_3379 [Bernardetia litoralis DSM 6794]|uniref:Protein involved in meta-pathway of phenol degradation n=1 Tax=Bernardetia litoralis (strain ATCC 23117 / DSM 6794 / NBRC 15988 / NCIMB 1366 / Fx l1 / Sio-4) TaxID=880071 RepID=I4AP18_BERLS|nr:hypothetical protein [Bernardetia litoralis]AFM05703.1 hypothetical protein Fleli_3379 [Bernardetia litoralis DSM 6794]